MNAARKFILWKALGWFQLHRSSLKVPESDDEWENVSSIVSNK